MACNGPGTERKEAEQQEYEEEQRHQRIKWEIEKKEREREKEENTNRIHRLLNINQILMTMNIRGIMIKIIMIMMKTMRMASVMRWMK